MLKRRQFTAIAVLLVTQAGALPDLEAEEAVLAEPATELRKAVQRDTAGADAGDAGRTKSRAPRAGRGSRRTWRCLKNADGRERRILFAEDICTRTKWRKAGPLRKELITSNETGIAYRRRTARASWKLPSTLTANTAGAV